MTSGE
jgi:hypothetical protein